MTKAELQERLAEQNKGIAALNERIDDLEVCVRYTRNLLTRL